MKVQNFILFYYELLRSDAEKRGLFRTIYVFVTRDKPRSLS